VPTMPVTAKHDRDQKSPYSPKIAAVII